jgi:hypothetical protein
VDDGAFSTRGGIWIFDRRIEAPQAANHETDTRKQIAEGDALPLVVSHANLVRITLFDYIPAFGRGLRFEVSDQDEASVFWTYRRSRIVRQLVHLGWTFDERPG